MVNLEHQYKHLDNMVVQHICLQQQRLKILNFQKLLLALITKNIINYVNMAQICKYHLCTCIQMGRLDELSVDIHHRHKHLVRSADFCCSYLNTNIYES